MAYDPPEGNELTFSFSGSSYDPPEGNLLAFNFLTRPPYAPPLGSKVGLDFTPAGYVPPLGSKVALEFVRGGSTPGENQYVFPASFDSLEFGVQYAWRYHQYVAVPGTLQSAYGSATVRLQFRFVVPSGWNSQAISTSSRIWNATFQAFPGGIAPPSQTEPVNANRQVPNPWISFRTRYITPAGTVHTTFGTSDISHYTRFVSLQNRGLGPESFGTTAIRLRTSFVNLIGFVATGWGTAAVKKQFIVTPVGWDSSALSDNAELLINTRRIYVYTGEADPAAYGIATVKNWNTLVNLNGRGISSLEIASPVQKIFNLKQQVTVGPYAENVDPTGWTNFYPFVENRIRYLSTFGHIDSRFPLNHWVYNKGVPVRPQGTDMTLWGEGTFISHRNRTVLAEGWNSFYNTAYTVVFNAAKVIAPPSLGDTSRFGRPDPVLNLNREVKQHSGWVGADFGTPFIAFGVRTLAPRPFNDVPWPLHEVRHNPHPIAPQGIPWQGQVGGHDLRLYRATISPFSVNVHSVPWVGEPVVESRNKTITTYGHDSAEFGRADIQNYIRYVAPVWVSTTGWGTTLIERRTKNVTPASMSPPGIVSTHRIYKDSPDPPSTQRIILSREDDSGNPVDGNGIPPGGVGAHSTRLATIYPFGWSNLSNFGTARIWTNNILPPTIFQDALFGIPTLNPPQWVYPTGFKTTSEDARSPRPRMTPHNIYAPYGDMAPVGYPQVPSFRQRIGDMVNSSFDQSAFPWFGRTDVQHRNRNISAVGKPSSLQFGTARFTLRRQYILPLGTRFVRFGLPVFWGVTQYVSLDEENNHFGINSLVFGPTTVARWVDPNAPKTAAAVGSAMAVWGSARVELLNRQVSPTGVPHRGNPQQGLTTPWGVPLVGYPRRYTLGLSAQTLWGSTTVDFLNRPVYPIGWINCSLEDENFDDFASPMKVVRSNPAVGATGVQPTMAFGACTVSKLVRTVYSRGVDSYNSGSHSVKASSTIGAQGWESLLIGDIDRWEAGKIKAHGDDMSTVGTPRLLHPLRALGFGSGVVVAPRIAPVVSPVGIPNIAFDGPSVTNPFGCTNRVVSPLPILSNQTVPSPVVA